MPGFPQTLPCLNSNFTLTKLRLCPILSASDMTAFLEVGVHFITVPTEASVQGRNGASPHCAPKYLFPKEEK